MRIYILTDSFVSKKESIYVSIQQCTRKECVSGHLQHRDADELIHMKTVRYRTYLSFLYRYYFPFYFWQEKI